MLRATCDGAMVGAHCGTGRSDVAQSHLAAVSARGYELMASYALYWFALQTFAGDASWLNLGAGSGLAADAGWRADRIQTRMGNRDAPGVLLWSHFRS